MESKSMKIDIITIHFGTNHGSVLQAYALSTYLRSLDLDTQVIDYVPKRYRVWNTLLRKRGNYPLPVLLAYYPIAVLRSCRVRRLFGKFVKKHLPLTKRYTTKEHLKQDPPKADIYITGSDQVWNDSYNGKGEYSYFLDFAPPHAKRMAYSASFGKEALQELDYREAIQPLLRRFSNISVRECEAQTLLQNWGIEAAHTVDPVFLLTREQWREFGATYEKKEPYTLVYVMDGLHGELLDYAQKVKEQTGNCIYVVAFKKIDDPRIDKGFYFATPKDFIGLMDNADAVVTNSFHGTAFSVLFQKNFLTLGKEQYNSRMLSLLDKLGLLGQFIPTGECCEGDKVKQAMVRKDIDRVDTLLQEWIAESKAYLDTAIKADDRSPL